MHISIDNFERLVEQARQNKKTRFAQGFFNVRRYYLFPLAIGCLVANTVADSLYPAITPASPDATSWVTLWLAITISITGAAGYFTRKNRDFDSQRFYYLEALRKTYEQQSKDSHAKEY